VTKKKRHKVGAGGGFTPKKAKKKWASKKNILKKGQTREQGAEDSSCPCQLQKDEREPSQGVGGIRMGGAVPFTQV